MKSGGVEFESRPKHVTLKTFKMIPTKVMTIVKVWEMHWSINRRNSLPFTVRTFAERVGCLLDIFSSIIYPWLLELTSLTSASPKRGTFDKDTQAYYLFIFLGGRG